MRYEGMVIRPPSEAGSLLIQVTLGCSNNKCTFCGTYRGKPFKVRKMDEIKEDLYSCAEQYGNQVRRVFLCDGDALVLKMESLREILTIIKERFPSCERVGSYATAKNILGKSDDELRELNALGLKILYLGLESGSDTVLTNVKKGMTRAEMIEAAQRAKAANMVLSVMVISGLGGRGLLEEHALQSADALNQMRPDYVGLLALMIERGTELYDEIQSGKFKLLTPREIVDEMYLMVGALSLNNCFFSSIHASNYINLRGTLPGDKPRLLEELKYYMEHEDAYKPEIIRRL